jgi:hypothetical protein
VKKGKTVLEKEFRATPMEGDQEIEIGLDHRTLVSVKNGRGETVLSICVVGAKGADPDYALVDLCPGVGNAIDVYYNNPRSMVFLQSMPASEYDTEVQSKKDLRAE